MSQDTCGENLFPRKNFLQKPINETSWGQVTARSLRPAIPRPVQADHRIALLREKAHRPFMTPEVIAKPMQNQNRFSVRFLRSDCLYENISICHLAVESSICSLATHISPQSCPSREIFQLPFFYPSRRFAALLREVM